MWHQLRRRGASLERPSVDDRADPVVPHDQHLYHSRVDPPTLRVCLGLSRHSPSTATSNTTHPAKAETGGIGGRGWDGGKPQAIVSIALDFHQSFYIHTLLASEFDHIMFIRAPDRARMSASEHHVRHQSNKNLFFF